MKIKSIKAYKANLALTRPYSIAYKTITDVENVFVEVELMNGIIGIGAGCPMEEVTGEKISETIQVLQLGKIQESAGQKIAEFQGIIRKAKEFFPKYPAALAAFDIALHDAFAQYLDIPLVDFWGRKIKKLPTSITIGIKNVDESLAEAQEYFEKGFQILKVKLGENLEIDVERLAKIREKFGTKMKIRVDPNQAYSTLELIEFVKKTENFEIELIEQPMKVASLSETKQLDWSIRKQLAADESLINPVSALELIDSPQACGIFNIKLMKCGGLMGAFEIATIARPAGIDLMWGCNDESIVSITAALHLAFACEHTKYIDLDGSFDLASDVVSGGFILENGFMMPNHNPGLGVVF